MKTLFAGLFLLVLLPQDTEKAKKEFNDGIATFEPYLVQKAAETLVKADTKEAVDVLLDGYGKIATSIKQLWTDKTRYTREMDDNADFEMKDFKTISQAGMVKFKKFKDAEEKALDVERKILTLEKVKNSIAEAFGFFKSDAAVKELVAKLAGAREWPRRAGIIEGLGKVSHSGAVPALLAHLPTEKDPLVKVACIDALKNQKARGLEVAGLFGEMLKDEFWQVKISAAQAIRNLPENDGRTAVLALIESLATVDGRIRSDINEVLVALTRVNRHGDHAAWKAWWDQNGESFKNGTYRPTGADAPSAPVGTSSFYGIPVKSKNVIFILDRSGSMMEPADWDEKDAIATGSKNPDAETCPKREGTRKIDIARWQLKRCLYYLPEGTEFNIIFFNHGITTMSERMVKLSVSTRKQAYDYIDHSPAESGTNIHDALEKAFTFAGTGAQDKMVKSSLDTIFFLTDGVPTAGTIQNISEIIEKTRIMNKLKKISINTIGVFTTMGGSSMQPGEVSDGTHLLKTLSDEHGGTFTDGKTAPVPK